VNKNELRELQQLAVSNSFLKLNSSSPQLRIQLQIDFGFHANWLGLMFFSKCSKRGRLEGRGNLNITFVSASYSFGSTSFVFFLK
jgi:hypothetical protein